MHTFFNLRKPIEKITFTIAVIRKTPDINMAGLLKVNVFKFNKENIPFF